MTVCTAAACSQSRGSLLSPASLKDVTQAKKDSGNWQTLEQRRSEAMPNGASTPVEGSPRASGNAASACESTTAPERVTFSKLLPAPEPMCEDLPDTLQEPVREEPEDKSQHSAPSSFGTKEQKCDSAIPLDATKQESPIAPGVDLSQAVASVGEILQTEVMHELRSFIESEVQSRCRQFEAQVEENFLRLEVVVREFNERTKEQGRRADESVAFLNSLKQENGLYERVQSLESTCQQAAAMPAIMLEAAESLRAELRQVVDPLREDVNSLKQDNASIQRSHEEFGDLAKSKDPELCSSLLDVSSLHARLLDLEVANGVESQIVTHFVDLMQKESAVFQERMNNLEGQLKEVQKDKRMEIAIAKLQHLWCTATQAKITLAEEPIATAEAAVSTDTAGSIMSRISASESMMTGQLGLSKTCMSHSQVQSQVPLAAQANGTLSSESHPAIPYIQRLEYLRHLIRDGGGRKDHKGMHGSVCSPASRQSEQCLQLKKATYAPQSSCQSSRSAVAPRLSSRSRSATQSRAQLGLASFSMQRHGKIALMKEMSP